MKLYTLDNQFIKEDSYPIDFTGIVGYYYGAKGWFAKGKRHRLDGPAVEYIDGSKEWWIDDKEVTEEQCKLLHSIMKLKALI